MKKDFIEFSNEKYLPKSREFINDLEFNRFIDDSKYFDSCTNYEGYRYKKFKINNYEVVWNTNFGYGQNSYNWVFVNYNNLRIKSLDADTVESFCSILNYVNNINENEKDAIIMELANMLTCYSQLSNNVTVIDQKVITFTGINYFNFEFKTLNNAIQLFNKQRNCLNQI